VDWAAGEARRRSRPLTVLSVVNYAGNGWTGPVGMAHWWPDAALEAGAAMSTEGAERARAAAPEVEVTPERAVGPIAPTLIEVSRTAELMVVGTRGHGEVENLALGSVAASLAAHGKCPVVIVRGDGDVHPDRDHPVVVGVDGSVAATAALAFAAETAEQAGAPLTVVCSWNAHPEELWMDSYARGVGGDIPDRRPEERHAGREALDQAVAWVRAEHPGIAVTPVLAGNPPADALLQAGADAGLLVVGTRGHGAFTSLLLGSVSHAVVHAATRPVAVVRGGIPEQVRQAEAAIPLARTDKSLTPA
jgi:nucleotide-binding universal stress UspA family protein